MHESTDLDFHPFDPPAPEPVSELPNRAQDRAKFVVGTRPVTARELPRGHHMMLAGRPVLEQRRRDALTLASESPLTVPESEALLIGCGGDMDRARREIANRVAMGAL